MHKLMGSFCCSRLHLSTVLLVRINNRNRCISSVLVVYISYEEYRGSDMTACILPETHCTGFIIPFHCMPMVHGAGDPRVASIHCEPGRGSQHPLAREWGRHSCDLAWTLQVSLFSANKTRAELGTMNCCNHCPVLALLASLSFSSKCPISNSRRA